MKIDPKTTLFLIDGSSFLYRAYYALRPLHTSKGQAIQAAYGFTTMIRKLIERFAPQHMVLVWDSRGKTVRHKIFKDYKATREAPPGDLFEQRELILEFAEAIGLHQLSKQGIEADDLMYSLAREWEEKGGEVIVVTSDKDMGQMITDKITLLDTFKDIMITADVFEAKMGFPVSKAAFYFSLLGDVSDNIPGVKGVGKKSALELVQQFESLKNLYDNLDKVEKTRTRTALAKNKEEAFLSEKLFLLQYEKTKVTEKQVAFDCKNWSKARKLFETLEFKTLLKDLTATEATAPATSIKSSKDRGYKYSTVTTQKQLDAIVSEIKTRKQFAYDTETDGTRPLQDNLVGIAICYQEKKACYIPCGHEEDTAQLSPDVVVKTLRPLFESSRITKIAHDAKFDQLVLSNYGVQFKGPILDTLLAAFLVKQDWQKPNLKASAQYHFDEQMLTYAHVVTDRKLPHFGYVKLAEATEYSADNAHQTFRLWPIFKKLLKEKDLEKLYYDVELPTMQVLFGMELKGIYCDEKVLYQLDLTVIKKLAETRAELVKLLGPKFAKTNFNSPSQVKKIIYEYLKLDPPSKTSRNKSGGFSADSKALTTLGRDHPVPALIAQFRELTKLKSTYIESLPEYINPKTKRIHTTYYQTRVATGRLSSSDPNMQNIPADGLGSTVRMAFQPDKGRVFLSADYSQLELRILAHFSREEVLVNAFLSGHDIHAETAAGLFNAPLSKVTKKQRDIGKRINFSILYGLTPYGLAKELEIPQKEAKNHIDAYFQHYPKVRAWRDAVIEQAQKDEYVKSWLGRKREVNNINERNRHLSDLDKRIAVNSVAQGTSSEIVKLGMVHVAKALKEKGLDAYILLQIHDELLLSVAKDQITEVKKVVKEQLETVVDWKVPLIVDLSTGKNWKEAK